MTWGKDHAVGWFIQVFDKRLPQSDPACVVVDKDALFYNLTVHELLELASAYNARDAVEREMYGQFM